MNSRSPDPEAPALTATRRYEFDVPADHVVVSMSFEHHALAMETLEMDSQSSMFDRSLREDLKQLLDAVTLHQPQAPTANDTPAQVRRIIAEGDTWERTSSLAELRQTVRNMRDIANAILGTLQPNADKGKEGA